MDRRSLVVGATALAALAGTRIPAAQASTAGAGRASALAHARQVLELVQVERGLVDLERAHSRNEDRVAVYLASAPRDPNADDLYTWTRRRATEISGADSLEAAYDKPQAQTLLAFGFVLQTQYQDIRLPELTRSMAVPDGLARLEADFFPELLHQIEIRIRSVPAFGDLLDAGQHEVAEALAKKKPGLKDQLKALDMFGKLVAGIVIGVEIIRKVV